MTWQTVLTLLCPLMMLFCMKGMFGGNKDSDKSAKITSEQPQVSTEELQALQIKMAELMEQNHSLMKELQSLKEDQSGKSAANV
ncbi:DUF2933 domain-containing protein [Effusibacillus consociatus]|uniref:DUF2933 domain-containing protein n=1 Tax=Effusibacillus consociatus TaxID=1117041 RepID=A0ABV9PYH8_9BACL